MSIPLCFNTTDGLDFQQLSSDSQFFPTESEDEALLCQNLIILDDDNFEKTHNFSVHVNTTGLEDGVSVVDPAYTTITITDNEGNSGRVTLLPT